jgi:hypothetical protein
MQKKALRYNKTASLANTRLSMYRILSPGPFHLAKQVLNLEVDSFWESASGSTLVQSVRFAWEANSPARAITLSTVPVDKVQYEVDNNIKEPEVSFEMSIGTLTQGNTTTVNSPNFNYFVNQAVEVVFKVTQADYDNAQRQFNTTG